MIRFLTEEFAFEPIQIPLDPRWNIMESQVETSDGTFFGYRFFPHKVEGEGFFITILKRPDSSTSQEPGKIKDFKHRVLKSINEREEKGFDPELGFEGKGKYYSLNDSTFWINQKFYRHFERIVLHLSLRYFGVELGKKQKNDWIPSHELALSTLPKNGFATQELNLD